MTRRGHILVAALVGVSVLAAAALGRRIHDRLAYGALKAQLRCGTVLTVATSAQKRSFGGRLVFCGHCDGRPYLLVGPSTEDLRALPIGDGGMPSFTAQDGPVFTLDCGDRMKTVSLEGDQCRVEDRPGL